MSEIEIRLETTGNRGRYVVSRPDGIAELTFSLLSDGKILADHTLVPAEWRGQGVALKLVERLVENARTDGRKIIPQCSYVAAQAQKHPEWADVFVQ
ncbi:MULTISPECIES: GNAT family N-acetyltransferase [Halocynthiibacter]|uniref:N-acetyltransferase n=1 Tax=Halocynthiibacter halioticoli TaxID=2986804 RepID=A0AAE3J248_9RHOB|nr:MULTISPECIES: GNAT family N-acetyltransferase [Halocynthiibacter]MCV6825261.1 N-acetyltransferase [Halocynthiibacter halioticoli]MCW4058262.1 N-acetyltransferase [Halocynthiibacter sp. SDUM655004]